MTLGVWIKFPKGKGALLKVNGPPPKDIHERNPLGWTETCSPIMNYTVCSDMLGSNFVNTTTERKKKY